MEWQSLEARILALEAAAADVTNTDAAAVSDMRDYQMHMLNSLRQVKGATREWMQRSIVEDASRGR